MPPIDVETPFDAGRFFGAMLEKTNLVVYLKDSDGRYIYVNPRYEALSGVPARLILGKKDADLFPPAVAELFRTQDAEVAARRGPMQFEEAIPLPSGTLSFVTEKFPLLDASGRVYAVGGFCAEVTAQDRRARESEDETQTLMKAIPDIFYRLDARMNLVDWNKVFEEVSGYGPQELKGMNALEFFRQDKGAIADGIREAVEKGHAFREGRFLTRDGRELPYFWSGAALRHPDGSLRGLVGVGRDLAARKREDRNLLTIQKLESLGLMAGGIAHDFNNLLTTVLGNLSLLQDGGALAPEHREVVERTLNAALKARHLTKQLLTFSKGGAPQKTVSPVAPLLREASMFVSSGSNAKCVFEFAEHLPLVEVDRGQLAQVVHNLVINAQQAMPEGGVIEVQADSVEVCADGPGSPPAGRYVRVVVKDSGPGIADEDLDKVFDPYFTTKREGRGLGLATSRSIVEMHGGRISIASRAGAGATVTILLPARPDAQVPPDPAAARASGGSGRVLVMDDEPEVAFVLAYILKKLGYATQSVCDGAKALEAYCAAREKDPFCAVVMDLTIQGGMGGKEAVKKLLALDPKAKVIVSSGYSDDRTLSDYAAHGFAASLSKPYTVAEVAQALAAVLAV
ncbi:MAG: PAS domain-containing protein [Elusimicrobia bacterium]|nr:PAS domain-containing protein [Elusimicrobiota bacterium]